MAEGYCDLMKKLCVHGGTKRFNFGFFQGTSGYCYKIGKWTHDMGKCPLVVYDANSVGLTFKE